MPSTAASRKRRAPKKSALPVWALAPSIPRSPTASTPELEALIAHMLLLRYEQDIARLFSTHIDNIARKYLPKIMERITLTSGSPGWCAVHGGDEVVKDFFRSIIAMDLRQAGERVAPRSLEWSYTNLRHFAMSNDVHICQTGDHGLQSFRLLPYLSSLQSYVKALASLPPPTFAPPTFKGRYSPKVYQDRLRSVLAPVTYDVSSIPELASSWQNWEEKAALGNTQMIDALWSVAQEFDPRGYGHVLKQKLNNWCDCGCSTEHLGEVCERTVRDDELAHSRKASKGKLDDGCGPDHRKEKGKEKEWDGRGGGIRGWGTKDEEDMWEKTLDLGGYEDSDDWEEQMTMGEQMEWRYLKAEREKEKGNACYKLGKYGAAIIHYLEADKTEPELPHYRLNAAQAYLQLGSWLDAERLCTSSLKQHPCSVKGLWRRAKARRMLGKTQGAIKDVRLLLKVQPSNNEALAALDSLLCPTPTSRSHSPASSTTSYCAECSAICCYASSSSSRSSGVPPIDPEPIPFELDDCDKRKLHVACIPVSLIMPDTNKSETFGYPSWERYRVERI